MFSHSILYLAVITVAVLLVLYLIHLWLARRSWPRPWIPTAIDVILLIVCILLGFDFVVPWVINNLP